jgi:hypothetical protein
MNRTLKAALQSSPEGRRYLKAMDEARREAERSRKAKRGRAPGLSPAERAELADAIERLGKAAAMKRAEDLPGVPRCEWRTNGQRCSDYATEAHHVLGGRWKPDVEALPNGEGYMALCRTHHQLNAHGAERLEALVQTKEHAIRVRSMKLLRLVEKALARWEARHPECAVRVIASGKS